ncbi:hypothetical protein [Arthrobacter sp. UNC362MFTsu5.1]|nr:hypothetical protein [Arthrobacter sp. UNC362MFTsu5.1]
MDRAYPEPATPAATFRVTAGVVPLAGAAAVTAGVVPLAGAAAAGGAG